MITFKQHLLEYEGRTRTAHGPILPGDVFKFDYHVRLTDTGIKISDISWKFIPKPKSPYFRDGKYYQYLIRKKPGIEWVKHTEKNPNVHKSAVNILGKAIKPMKLPTNLDLEIEEPFYELEWNFYFYDKHYPNDTPESFLRKHFRSLGHTYYAIVYEPKDFIADFLLTNRTAILRNIDKLNPPHDYDL